MTTIGQRYHTLDDLDLLNSKMIDGVRMPCPLDGEYSCLQLLYPGRAMRRGDDFNPYSIPHEDPMAARRGFIESTRQTREYAAGLERRVREDGGGDAAKVNMVVSEDPAIVTDDPDLKFTNMMEPTMVNDAFPMREPPPVRSSAAYINEQVHSRVGIPEPIRDMMSRPLPPPLGVEEFNDTQPTSSGTSKRGVRFADPIATPTPSPLTPALDTDSSMMMGFALAFLLLVVIVVLLAL